ncbi:hypothetical protein BGZ72_000706, partial [Mortierella alpina]
MSVSGNYRTEVPARLSIKLQEDLNLRSIRSILEGNNRFPSISRDDAASRRNLRKLRYFYSSCMNEAQIARVGRQPLLDEIKTIVNLFPVKGSLFESLQNTTELEASGRLLMNSTSGMFPQAFSNALGHILKMGMSAFVCLKSERDSNGSGLIFVLYFDYLCRHSITTRSEGEVAPGSYDNYEAVAKTLYLLTRREDHHSFDSSGGPRLPPEGVPGDWNDVVIDALILESRFGDQMATEWSAKTLQELSNASRNINFTLALLNALPDDVAPPRTVALYRSRTDLFDSVLGSATNNVPLPLQVQTYLVWTVVKQLISQIDPKYGHFLQPNHGVEQERWRHCTAMVNTTMGKMVAPFFARAISNEHYMALDMVNSIRRQLHQAYKTASGIDNSTKVRGFQELYSLSIIELGSESHIADVSEELAYFYRNLTIDRNDYFGNRKNFAMWYTANSLRGIEGFVQGGQSHVLPQSSYIHQDIYGNKTQVPAGSFRPPLFHDSYPGYVNFGIMGAMIAQSYV